MSPSAERRKIWSPKNPLMKLLWPIHLESKFFEEFIVAATIRICVLQMHELNFHFMWILRLKDVKAIAPCSVRYCGALCGHSSYLDTYN